MLKKYWPVITLVVISLCGLGFYYIDMAKANHYTHNIELETVEGDDNYLDDVLLEVGYSNNYLYQNYYVEKDQVTKNDGLLYYGVSDYEMQQLVEEEKNFFRAKRMVARNYYNDDHSLVYVYTDDSYNGQHPHETLYKIDILNKETNESETYEFTAPVDKPYSWQTVEFVSYIDQQLKVLSLRAYGHEKDEVVLTTFDLEQETVSEKVLVEPLNNEWASFENQLNSSNSNQYAVFSQYHARSYTENETDGRKAIYHFDAVTNELHDIETDKIGDFSEYIVHVYNEYITGFKEHEGNVHIVRYNMKTKEWLQDYTVELELEVPEELWQYYQVIGDKIYITYEIDNGLAVEIIDANNGEKLYVGLLTISDVERPFNLYVQRFHLVN